MTGFFFGHDAGSRRSITVAQLDNIARVEFVPSPSLDGFCEGPAEESLTKGASARKAEERPLRARRVTALTKRLSNSIIPRSTFTHPARNSGVATGSAPNSVASLQGTQDAKPSRHHR